MKSQQYKDGEKRREAEEIDRNKLAQRRKVRKLDELTIDMRKCDAVST